MGLQFFRKEFALLLRMQLYTLAGFVLVSAVLLAVGLGGLHPFRLLWSIGICCIAVDTIATNVVYTKWEKAAEKNRRRHEK